MRPPCRGSPPTHFPVREAAERPSRRPRRAPVPNGRSPPPRGGAPPPLGAPPGAFARRLRAHPAAPLAGVRTSAASRGAAFSASVSSRSPVPPRGSPRTRGRARRPSCGGSTPSGALKAARAAAAARAGRMPRTSSSRAPRRRTRVARTSTAGASSFHSGRSTGTSTTSCSSPEAAVRLSIVASSGSEACSRVRLTCRRRHRARLRRRSTAGTRIPRWTPAARAARPNTAPQPRTASSGPPSAPASDGARADVAS